MILGFHDSVEWVFWAGILALIMSMLTFHFGVRRRSLYFPLLLVGGFALRWFAAHLDPFLHCWDEQFHALVAKNMLDDPFRPVLHKTPLLEYDYTEWSNNHIWLHKQPFFLWLMAISFKLFGVSVWTLRWPSILLSTLVVGMVVRIGQMLVNERVGYYAGLLTATAFYTLTLNSGMIPSEHNDLAFLFCVTGSYWAWLKYMRQAHWKWVILVGLLAGCAVLNKWLTGLIVYGVWGLGILAESERRGSWRSYRDGLMAFAVSLLVFLPWQIYIRMRFPREAAWEAEYNTRHFFEALEGHPNSWDFHFLAVKDLYWDHSLTLWVLLGSVIFMAFRLRRWHQRLFILSVVGAVYSFFTMAAMKMMGYTYIAAPVIYLCVAGLLSWLVVKAERVLIKISAGLAGILAMTALACICWNNLQVEQLLAFHTQKETVYDYTKFRTDFALKMRSLQSSLRGRENVVILHCERQYHVSAMFYTGYEAYPELPEVSVIRDLQDKGYYVVICERDNDVFPEEVKALKDIRWLYLGR